MMSLVKGTDNVMGNDTLDKVVAYVLSLIEGAESDNEESHGFYQRFDVVDLIEDIKSSNITLDGSATTEEVIDALRKYKVVEDDITVEDAEIEVGIKTNYSSFDKPMEVNTVAEKIAKYIVEKLKNIYEIYMNMNEFLYLEKASIEDYFLDELDVDLVITEADAQAIAQEIKNNKTVFFTSFDYEDDTYITDCKVGADGNFSIKADIRKINDKRLFDNIADYCIKTIQTEANSSMSGFQMCIYFEEIEKKFNITMTDRCKEGVASAIWSRVEVGDLVLDDDDFDVLLFTDYAHNYVEDDDYYMEDDFEETYDRPYDDAKLTRFCYYKNNYDEISLQMGHLKLKVETRTVHDDILKLTYVVLRNTEELFYEYESNWEEIEDLDIIVDTNVADLDKRMYLILMEYAKTNNLMWRYQNEEEPSLPIFMNEVGGVN